MTQTTKGRDESRYRQEATASRTGSSPPRVRDGKRVEHTAPSPQSQTTKPLEERTAYDGLEVRLCQSPKKMSKKSAQAIQTIIKAVRERFK